MKIRILKHENEKHVGQIVEAVVCANHTQAAFFDEDRILHCLYNYGFSNSVAEFEVIEENKHKETLHEKFLSDYVPSRLDYFCASILSTLLANVNIYESTNLDFVKTVKRYAQEMIRVLDEN